MMVIMKYKISSKKWTHDKPLRIILEWNGIEFAINFCYVGTNFLLFLTYDIKCKHIYNTNNFIIAFIRTTIVLTFSKTKVTKY